MEAEAYKDVISVLQGLMRCLGPFVSTCDQTSTESADSKTKSNTIEAVLTSQGGNIMKLANNVQLGVTAVLANVGQNGSGDNSLVAKGLEASAALAMQGMLHRKLGDITENSLAVRDVVKAATKGGATIPGLGKPALTSQDTDSVADVLRAKQTLRATAMNLKDAQRLLRIAFPRVAKEVPELRSPGDGAVVSTTGNDGMNGSNHVHTFKSGVPVDAHPLAAPVKPGRPPLPLSPSSMTATSSNRLQSSSNSSVSGGTTSLTQPSGGAGLILIGNTTTINSSGSGTIHHSPDISPYGSRPASSVIARSDGSLTTTHTCRISGDLWSVILADRKEEIERTLRSDVMELFNYGEEVPVLLMEDISNVRFSIVEAFIYVHLVLEHSSASVAAGLDAENINMRLSLCSFPGMVEMHEQEYMQQRRREMEEMEKKKLRAAGPESEDSGNTSSLKRHRYREGSPTVKWADQQGQSPQQLEAASTTTRLSAGQSSLGSSSSQPREPSAGTRAGSPLQQPPPDVPHQYSPNARSPSRRSEERLLQTTSPSLYHGQARIAGSQWSLVQRNVEAKMLQATIMEDIAMHLQLPPLCIQNIKWEVKESATVSNTVTEGKKTTKGSGNIAKGKAKKEEKASCLLLDFDLVSPPAASWLGTKTLDVAKTDAEKALREGMENCVFSETLRLYRNCQGSQVTSSRSINGISGNSMGDVKAPPNSQTNSSSAGQSLILPDKEVLDHASEHSNPEPEEEPLNDDANEEVSSFAGPSATSSVAVKLVGGGARRKPAPVATQNLARATKNQVGIHHHAEPTSPFSSGSMTTIVMDQPVEHYGAEEKPIYVPFALERDRSSNISDTANVSQVRACTPENEPVTLTHLSLQYDVSLEALQEANPTLRDWAVDRPVPDAFTLVIPRSGLSEDDDQLLMTVGSMSGNPHTPLLGHSLRVSQSGSSSTREGSPTPIGPMSAHDEGEGNPGRYSASPVSPMVPRTRLDSSLSGSTPPAKDASQSRKEPQQQQHSSVCRSTESGVSSVLSSPREWQPTPQPRPVDRAAPKTDVMECHTDPVSCATQHQHQSLLTSSPLATNAPLTNAEGAKQQQQQPPSPAPIAPPTSVPSLLTPSQQQQQQQQHVEKCGSTSQPRESRSREGAGSSMLSQSLEKEPTALLEVPQPSERRRQAALQPPSQLSIKHMKMVTSARSLLPPSLVPAEKKASTSVDTAAPAAASVDSNVVKTSPPPVPARGGAESRVRACPIHASASTTTTTTTTVADLKDLNGLCPAPLSDKDKGESKSEGKSAPPGHHADSKDGEESEARRSGAPVRLSTRIGVRLDRILTVLKASGSAAEAGICEGDVIRTVNGHAISSPREFKQRVAAAVTDAGGPGVVFITVVSAAMEGSITAHRVRLVNAGIPGPFAPAAVMHTRGPMTHPHALPASSRRAPVDVPCSATAVTIQPSTTSRSSEVVRVASKSAGPAPTVVRSNSSPTAVSQHRSVAREKRDEAWQGTLRSPGRMFSRGVSQDGQPQHREEEEQPDFSSRACFDPVALEAAYLAQQLRQDSVSRNSEQCRIRVFSQSPRRFQGDATYRARNGEVMTNVPRSTVYTSSTARRKTLKSHSVSAGSGDETVDHAFH